MEERRDRRVGTSPAFGASYNRMKSPLLRFFKFAHLQNGMGKDFSHACAMLAISVDETIPDNTQKEEGLNLLLKAKDCFVRACLPPEE